MTFDKTWFLNFVDISIEKFADINSAIAVTQTFQYFFSEIYMYFINCDIAFCKFIRTFENN